MTDPIFSNYEQLLKNIENLKEGDMINKLVEKIRLIKSEGEQYNSELNKLVKILMADGLEWEKALDKARGLVG